MIPYLLLIVMMAFVIVKYAEQALSKSSSLQHDSPYVIGYREYDTEYTIEHIRSCLNKRSTKF